MAYEIITSTTATLHWRSARTKKTYSVRRLLDEVGMTIAMVREYGLQGTEINGKRFGLHRIDYLVEKGCLKPMVLPISDDDDFMVDPYEATSLADLMAARKELQEMLDKHPGERSKETEII